MAKQSLTPLDYDRPSPRREYNIWRIALALVLILACMFIVVMILAIIIVARMSKGRPPM